MWRRTKILLSLAVPASILALYLGLWICRFNQWDSLTYITLIPIWMWSLAGILISLIASICIRTRFSVLVFLIWLLTGLLVSAEAKGVFRKFVATQSGETDVNVKPESAFRIVSINCKGGNIRAAYESVGLEPDIVFLQEAPTKDNVEELCKRIFGKQGSYISTEGNAIIGKGQFITFAESEHSPTIHARFKHQRGALLDLTNLKLDRSIPEKAIWKSDVRDQMRVTRIQNRKLVRQFVGDYGDIPDQPVRIIAGDFATPPGDDIFRPMKQVGLNDAFHLSGRGTGATFPGQRPFLRLNQIWISPDSRPLKTYTRFSEHTDHRLLICDFLIE